LAPVCRCRYGLRQIAGVGILASLAFVLTLEDPARFSDSRQVGAYVGLVPGIRQSGDCDRQMHIPKEGDSFLRQLLVQSAHYVLGPFGPDCDLRRHGMKLAHRGGKAAKKRAAVAVARKIAVVLHRLWLTQQRYEPLRDIAPETVARPCSAARRRNPEWPVEGAEARQPPSRLLPLPQARRRRELSAE
jgi:transposase